MNKRRKTLLVSIFAILLMIVFLSGYTFAKYYADYTETVAGEIAKWNFAVSCNSEISSGKIALVNTADSVSLEDGKIAPGASGSFEINLNATGSEVDVKYFIEIAENGNKPNNLLFSVKKNDGSESVKYSSLSQLADSELKGVIHKQNSESSNSQTEKIVINWEWPYETITNQNGVVETNATARNQLIVQEDAEDTKFGTGTVSGHENEFDYSFTMKIVGTQAKTTD